MSTLIMSACWPLQIAPTAKAVLISLADNSNDHGECWPAIATIAMRTCFSARAVQGAIKRLEADGLVVADRSNGRHTRYRITVQPPQQLHPRMKCAPADVARTLAAAASLPRSSCVPPPQEVPTNRKEPSKNHQEPTAMARSASLVLPEWLPADVWAEWHAYRTAKRSWTATAQRLSLRTLTALHADGHDPRQVIETSIERGWSGLFSPGHERGQREKCRSPKANDDFTGVAYNSGTRFEDLPPELGLDTEASP